MDGSMPGVVPMLAYMDGPRAMDGSLRFMQRPV